MGTFLHATEGEMLCTSSMPDKVPHFNAPIYLANKSAIGKIDEILGPINEVYFSVKMNDGVVANSFKKGDKVFISGEKLLPIDRFLPKPKAVGGIQSAFLFVFKGWRAGVLTLGCRKKRRGTRCTWWTRTRRPKRRWIPARWWTWRPARRRPGWIRWWARWRRIRRWPWWRRAERTWRVWWRTGTRRLQGIIGAAKLCFVLLVYVYVSLLPSLLFSVLVSQMVACEVL